MPSKAELAKTKAFLDSLGIKVPEVEKASNATPMERNLAKEYPDPTTQTSREMASIQAEHVLLSLEYPELAGIPKLCKECQSPFTTRYKSMGYCGDLCRAAALRKRGIIWWPEGTSESEKWGGRIPPGNIPPDALRAMQTILNRVELETGHPVQTTLPDFVPPQPSASQLPDYTEHLVESVEALPDKTGDIPPEPIQPQSKDDFSEFLSVLDEL